MLCTARISTLFIMVTKQKNTDSEQFSDNSLSMSEMHACMRNSMTRWHVLGAFSVAEHFVWPRQHGGPLYCHILPP